MFVTAYTFSHSVHTPSPHTLQWAIGNLYLAMSPISVPSSGGDLDTHLTPGSLGPHKYAPQIGSQLVQPSCRVQQKHHCDIFSTRPHQCDARDAA